MIQQPDLPIAVNLQIDNQFLEKYMKEYLSEYCHEYLKPEWLTISDLEKITRRKRTWIMENIIYDPYVRKNKIAKRDGDSPKAQWLVDAKKIRPFLNRLFEDLPDY